MEEHIRKPGEEWGGQQSCKFWPNKKHVEPVYSTDPQYKQIFDTKGRTHFDERRSDEFAWKPSRTQIDFDSQHEVKRPSAKATVNKEITEANPRAQRTHFEEKISGSYEDDEVGIRTFVEHNRRSINEYLNTDLMGKKKHIDFEDTRNGIGVASQGDKKYKAVEYSERFFHEGGLIAGSTHQAHIKSAGNAKAIDFYAGLKLDGPLNKDRVKWTDKVKKEELDLDVGDVKSLDTWEKTILKEVDPNYECSDDENAPKVKKEEVPDPKNVPAKGKKK